jgi:predicted RNA-binding Zn ribbon-like protein
LAAIVAVVNGWGTVPRAVAGQQDLPLPDVEELAGLLPGGRTGSLRPATLVALADRLHPVFAADVPALRVRRTAALLKETGVRPALEVGPDGVHAGWTVDRAAEAWLAAAAVSLRQHLEENDGERLGLCTATRCADVYVDASPGGRRRYCSITCQNRVRVAAFRRRTGQATEEVTHSR